MAGGQRCAPVILVEGLSVKKAQKRYPCVVCASWKDRDLITGKQHQSQGLTVYV